MSIWDVVVIALVASFLPAAIENRRRIKEMERRDAERREAFIDLAIEIGKINKRLDEGGRLLTDIGGVQ